MKSIMTFLFYLFYFTSVTLASPRIPHQKREVVTVTETVSNPYATSPAWNSGATVDFPIHPSCNATERAQLQRAFADAIKLAQHAKEHILRFGNSSDFFVKYFGSAATAEPVGWFEKIVSADRNGMWFRCDDPDGNCESQDDWRGHWRGSNATRETVICPLSYSTRWTLESMCGYGWTVANGNPNAYFGSDIVHRLFHVPNIGEGVVEHYAEAEGYAGVLELAKTNPELTVRNSDTLSYFMLDVYAYDIALPGQGCTGQVGREQGDAYGSSAIASSTASSATNATVSSATVVSSTIGSPAPALTSMSPSYAVDAPADCHAHGDGDVHCD